MVGILLSQSLQAGKNTSSQQLGAHWAKLSDKAQIELLIDKIANLDVGSRSAFVSAGAKIREIPVTGNAINPAIAIDGTTAVATFTGGSELRLVKTGSQWRISGGALPRRSSGVLPNALPVGTGGDGITVGATFTAVPISREHHIDRLSRDVTRSRLDRTLFGVPGRTASYYSARYTNDAPFVQSTYVQFVVDGEWSRILYGNVNRWIKAYQSVSGPSCIAASPDGRVFVGETGAQRISVLELVGEGNDAQLIPSFVIPDVTNPTDVAFSDNGTPLNSTDDFLYVADAAMNTVVKYALANSGASVVSAYGEFDGPTSIIVGRWNGTNTNTLYVVDAIAKRLRAYQDLNCELVLVAEMRGNYSQYFTSLKVDHFGSVYVVDNVNSTLLKFTSELELLDTDGSPSDFAALGFVDIPFGSISIEGEGTYWAGFDQVFAVERWGNTSGAQRRALGLRLKNIAFQTDADVSRVQNGFVLTDAGEVSVRIYDSRNSVVRDLGSSWLVPGRKEIVWDRRDNSGNQVAPGEYRYELKAIHPYHNQPTLSGTRLYLPLYYHENSGSALAHEDRHLVRGTRISWGNEPSQSANQDPSEVVYTFSGLDPTGEYMVAAEYAANDGILRRQELRVNNASLHEPLAVGNSVVYTDYVAIPQIEYSEGNLTIRIKRLGEGSASVSQLWLKQVGVGFESEPVNTSLPTSYALEQNYPNPFNPTTTIRYALPQTGVVSLKVYTIAGQEVATLVNGQQNAGLHEIRFDAGSLASGVYFYRLQAEKFTSTRKLLLLK